MINNRSSWRIVEHHDIEKTCRRLPSQIVEKYDYWKELVSVYVIEITPHEY